LQKSNPFTNTMLVLLPKDNARMFDAGRG